MFKNVLRKIVGYGLALCLVGTLVFTTPPAEQTAYDTVIVLSPYPPPGRDEPD